MIIIKIKKQLKRIISVLFFPHLITCYIIIAFAVVSILLSFYFNANSNDYMSSLFSNIFAGLITGLIICLISGVKQIYKSKLNSQKDWLIKLAEMYQDYNKLYYKLIQAQFTHINDSKDIYDLAYDVGSSANHINCFISQSSFNNTILFDPRKYSVKMLNYDADALEDYYNELRDDIMKLDSINSSKKETIQCFNDVNRKLINLNHSVHLCIRKTDEQLSSVEKTII